jgi:hypothetical protein
LEWNGYNLSYQNITQTLLLSCFAGIYPRVSPAKTSHRLFSDSRSKLKKWVSLCKLLPVNRLQANTVDIPVTPTPFTPPSLSDFISMSCQNITAHLQSAPLEISAKQGIV